jgi:hypothetical protein
MIKLTLGYSTMAQRVGNIVQPPLHKDWNVAIIIQNPENMAWRGSGLAELVMRDDLEIQELNSIGVAKSRNRAIWLARLSNRCLAKTILLMMGWVGSVRRSRWWFKQWSWKTRV